MVTGFLSIYAFIAYQTFFHHTLFLFSGFAEHFLCELKARWSPTDDELIPSDLRLEMLSSVIILMTAAKYEVVGCSGNIIISSLMEEIKTPTEQSMRFPSPSEPHEVKSLRVMKNLKSPANQCQTRVKPSPDRVIDMQRKETIDVINKATASDATDNVDGDNHIDTGLHSSIELVDINNMTNTLTKSNSEE